jgi:DNA-binding PadR family transcriptional regulator
MRFGHGELHLALLGLMSQRPMHGYELMAELSTRMGRKYRASPGSIYPAVQALEAEGLISGADESDKRIYSLTDEGKLTLENRAHRLAALESRLGVRFTRGVDPDLARFAERVRAVAPRLPEPVLSNAIDVAASEIERMANDHESERGDGDE